MLTKGQTALERDGVHITTPTGPGAYVLKYQEQSERATYEALLRAEMAALRRGSGGSREP